MFAGIIGSIISGFFGSGLGQITSALKDAYQAKLNAQNETERLEADQNIATLEAQRAVLVAEAASGGFQSWIRPLFALPFVVWTWVVVFVDPIGCKWLFGHACSTDPLSPAMSNMMAIVVGAYFIGRTAEKVTRIFKG